MEEHEEKALRLQVVALTGALVEYASHQAWRCEYRSRYGRCVCGLDEVMESLGLPPVPVQDPEAPKPDVSAGEPAGA